MTTNNSNTTSTVNLNITKDKSYTEKSNNYYEDIDNEILQNERRILLMMIQERLFVES